jgi:hypothetical protein
MGTQTAHRRRRSRQIMALIMPLSILKTWSDVFQVKRGLACEHLTTDATSLPTLQPGLKAQAGVPRHLS